MVNSSSANAYTELCNMCVFIQCSFYIRKLSFSKIMRIYQQGLPIRIGEMPRSSRQILEEHEIAQHIILSNVVQYNPENNDDFTVAIGA